MYNKQKEAYKRFKEIKAQKEQTNTKKVGRPTKRVDEVFMEGLEREYERVRNIYDMLEPNNIIPTYRLTEF